MKKSKELHVSIIAAVLGGKITDEESIIKKYTTYDDALHGFNNASATLFGMNFKECSALNMPNKTSFRIFEKGHWPYLICLSVEANLLVITMTDKEKLLQHLSSTL